MKQKILKCVGAFLLMCVVGVTTLFGTPLSTMAENEADTEKVTTEAVTLKVGDIWSVSSKNIDELLAKAGLEYASPYETIYHGEKVTVDAAYIAMASCCGVCDASTGTTIEMLYYTDAEFPALFEAYESGALNEKYGKEVWLVDEAEGMPYHARAEKAGETTITISAYTVGNVDDTTTITVNIPIVIEEAEQPAPSEPMEPSETITSNKDENIVIDNADGVLPGGTVLTSEKLESGDVFNNAKVLIGKKVENLGGFVVYELNLSDAKGVEVHQLEGKIKVTMNVPFKMEENSTLKVYRVDDGKLTDCPATVSNGKVTFETDHFSTYILSEQKEIKATGDASFVYLTILTSGILLCGVAVFEKKRRAM